MSSNNADALPTGNETHNVSPEAQEKQVAITDKAIKTRRGRAKILAGTKDMHYAAEDAETVIKFDHVTKSYDLYKGDMARFLGLLGIKRKRLGYLKTVNANDDLSFEIKRGESVALMGLNGAGKSTALKMITGVTHPTSGTVTVNGRVSALLELSAGFNKHLSGRDNIRLRGQIIGLSNDDLKVVLPQAIEFADLGSYIDQPISSYSSGMRARLGFALAVSVKPEILVIDEALAVGDRQFKKKCVTRIREIMMDSSLTVLLVAHSSSTAQAICTRGIVIDKGKKLYESDIDDATAFYESHF